MHSNPLVWHWSSSPFPAQNGAGGGRVATAAGLARSASARRTIRQLLFALPLLTLPAVQTLLLGSSLVNRGRLEDQTEGAAKASGQRSSPGAGGHQGTRDR